MLLLHLCGTRSSSCLYPAVIISFYLLALVALPPGSERRPCVHSTQLRSGQSQLLWAFAEATEAQIEEEQQVSAPPRTASPSTGLISSVCPSSCLVPRPASFPAKRTCGDTVVPARRTSLPCGQGLPSGSGTAGGKGTVMTDIARPVNTAVCPGRPSHREV